MRVAILLVSMIAVALPALAADEDDWHFTIRPVIWNPSVLVRVSDSDEGEAIIDPEYCFFCVDNLTNYLALQAEARRSRFALLFDGLRARFEDTPFGGPGNLTIASKLGFVGLAAAYQHSPDIPLEAYLGVRYTFVDNDIRLGSLPEVRQDGDWLDPIIGARYTYSFNRDWSLRLQGDIGGFGVATDWMTNASADIVYRISELLQVNAGYRYLDIEFDDDDFLYDANLKGLQLGLAFSF